ncbi:hypothetical protein EC973_001905 [Apophysomyces ossiformis]|uniref:Uncharacterized protein n=1 Tax=Apophysomyces ossiformis TaxID=679940 RepID=A0A8H7BUD5_9FUNG|nr:hypothetical protein EC973_001905 [Apophysomyces ossiformis]
MTGTTNATATSEEANASLDRPVAEADGSNNTEAFVLDPAIASTAYEEEKRRQAMKRRNYKFWSDAEVRKILEWMTSEGNIGKFSRNKAQACREVAKELFNGDEYMAISIRSKLMSLEKCYFAAERLRASLKETDMDESTINAKVTDFNRFQEESRALFAESSTPIASTTSASSVSQTMSTTTTAPVVIPATPENVQDTNATAANVTRPILSRIPEVLPSPEYTAPLELPTLPAAAASVLNDREERMTHVCHCELSEPSHPRRSYQTEKRKASDDHPDHEYSNEKKAAIRQARYAARQAEFEAIKAKHEEQKMEFAVKLAEIEKERDLLGLRKLELEMEIIKLRGNL